jgi:hypothetical protein
MRKLILSIAIILVATMFASGQGLFRPITVDQLSTGNKDKAGTGAWFFRINAAMTATTVKLSFDEAGEFNGLKSSFLSKAGMGMSYSHYIEADGVVKNNYSVNGLLLMPLDGDTNVAVAVTGSFYNINAGFGYDCLKGPFKNNIFGLFGVQLAF